MKPPAHTSRVQTIVAALALLAACWVAPRSATAQLEERAAIESGRPPNIVLIMADDVGVEAFTTYGGTSYSTPNIDTLAQTGVQFNNCHAQPLCTPTRVKIMTGKSNVWNYSRFSLLEPGEYTFAHMLKEAGYATAVAGKWQLYGAEHYGEWAGKGTLPRDAGFDEWCLWQVKTLGSRYADPMMELNGEIILDTEGKYGPDLSVDFICDFMERKQDQPFFIYFPMALVHNPFDPTPDSEPDAKRDRARFADMMTYMDTLVGRITDKLDELELRDNTLLVFVGDNGTNRAIRSDMNDQEIRGGKRLTTDAGTHVPLIVNWPGHAATGTTCDDLIDMSYFFPTLAAAAQMNANQLPPVNDDPQRDGVSFLPQIMGKPGTPRDWLYCYYNPRPGRDGFPEYRFARDTRWKLYSTGELFDVPQDRQEQRPIKAEADTDDSRAARHRLQKVIDSYPKIGLRLRPDKGGS